MMVVRWLSAATALLVIVQASLIGQYLFLGHGDMLGLHGWLGSGSFVLAILLTAAAFMAVRQGELPRSVLLTGLVVTALMVVQLGLGYMGRKLGLAAAIHIPNGVFIASLLTALLATTFVAPRTTSR